MTLGNPRKESRDREIERVNALLAEIGSFYRYHIVKAPYTRRRVLELTPSGNELQAIEERGFPAGTHRMYELLTGTAEICHAMRILADLVTKLQEEGLLRKKVNFC
jgi:hypothetical protein